MLSSFCRLTGISQARDGWVGGNTSEKCPIFAPDKYREHHSRRKKKQVYKYHINIHVAGRERMCKR